MSDNEEQQGMELDEVTSKMTLPPESLAEEGKIVAAATKIYSDEMGEEDTVGEDKDVLDFVARPPSPEGATDLGSQSDKEVELLKEQLTAPQTPRSRSTSRTRKGKEATDDKQQDPETPKQKPKGQSASSVLRSVRKGPLPGTSEGTVGDRTDKTPAAVPLSEHPLLSKIDIDNEKGFKVTISSKPSNVVVPDPLFVLREATGKSLAQGKDILTHSEAPNMFPVSTAKSWASATALMLATIEKMAKVFKLPDFEVSYNRNKMSFEVIQHPSIRGSSDNPALRVGTPQIAFKQRPTVNAATETDPDPRDGPSPAKVPRPTLPGKFPLDQSVFKKPLDKTSEPLPPVSEIPSTSGDQEMDVDAGPSSEASPAPSVPRTDPQPPEATMTTPPLPFEFPTPCNVRSAFGGRIDLDILRFVEKGELRSKLEKWAHFQAYLLAKDPVIRQLCGYMATGNEGIYQAVHSDILMKFIELLEAPSKLPQ